MYDEEMDRKEAERLLEEERRQSAEAMQKQLQAENENLKAKLAAATEEAEKLKERNLLQTKQEEPEEEKDEKVKPEKADEEESEEEDLSTCFMLSTFNVLFLFFNVFPNFNFQGHFIYMSSMLQEPPQPQQEAPKKKSPPPPSSSSSGLRPAFIFSFLSSTCIFFNCVISINC